MDKTQQKEKLYDKAYDWVLTHGPSLITGIIILFIGLWLIRVLRRWISNHMARKQVHSSLQPFFLSLSITAMYVLLVILVMEIVGIQLTIFTAVIGAATVAAGLALSGTLQNFAGGIMILLLKPFGIDDHIIAQGQEGHVTGIQIFYTEIITFDNKTVIIPNGKLFNEVIVNVTRQGKRRLDITIKLNYGFDVDQVKGVINKSIDSVPNILVEPARRIGILSLDPDGATYSIEVWVDPHNFFNSKLALQEQLIQNLKAAGIKLPGMS